MQAWYFNLRRPVFKDPRVREAITLCFDFEWTNKNVMYSSYKRVTSHFQNTAMEAKGKPGPEELKLLEPWRGKVPDEVFGEPYLPPVSDGSGSDRALLKRAYDLLIAAGCKRDGAAMKLPDGQPLAVRVPRFLGTVPAAHLAVAAEHEEARHRRRARASSIPASTRRASTPSIST